MEISVLQEFSLCLLFSNDFFVCVGGGILYGVLQELKVFLLFHFHCITLPLPYTSQDKGSSCFLGLYPKWFYQIKIYMCIFMPARRRESATLTWCLNFLPSKPSWRAGVITENSSTISWEFCSCLQQTACSCLSIGGLPVHQFINK